jgi:glycosyltransferase involved in cell wall biosynthesis
VSAPALSVVVPVYDEPEWIGVAVRALEEALERSPFAGDAEIVVVDDGSAEPTRAALERLETSAPLRVVHQDNQGRLRARLHGLEVAEGELALLLDSRVTLDPGALRFAAERIAADPAANVWNGHVHVEVGGNPFARFWNVLTEVAFAEYFADPRETSFGPEEFDRFPKGTTCFLAPRQLLLDAMGEFSSLYADVKRANDDTIVLRALAERTRIRIGPGFSCRYHGRGSVGQFWRHARHRGGVFVDGYGRPGTRFFAVIVAFFPASAGAAALALRRPRLGLLGAALLPAAWAGAALRWRRPAADVAAMAALGPVWLLAYAAGMWGGLLHAIRSVAGR